MIRREYQGLLDKVKEHGGHEEDEEDLAEDDIYIEENGHRGVGGQSQIKTREAFSMAFRKNVGGGGGPRSEHKGVG